MVSDFTTFCITHPGSHEEECAAETNSPAHFTTDSGPDLEPHFNTDSGPNLDANFTTISGTHTGPYEEESAA
jgi:hypothetical protein